LRGNAVLTTEQLESFHTVGFLHLQQVVPARATERMVDHVWELMGHQGLERDDPTSWEKIAPYDDIRGVQKLRDLRNEPTSPEDFPLVRAALDGVFAGSARQQAQNWGQALVTLPVAASQWLMPSKVWHFDHFYRHPCTISGVNVFLLIDDVEVGGGGTVVLRNAPLLMDKYLATDPVHRSISDQNKGFLQFDPWLRGLKTSQRNRSVQRNRSYMDGDTSIREVPARIVELTGMAGDVFIAHPALLHAPAMNVRDRPRLMRTQRIYVQPETVAAQQPVEGDSNVSQ
jgi:hypothetical protein